MESNKTAILIFANSAEKELNSKSIQSAAIFNVLNTETVNTVKKTGLPYFHFSEKEQIGTDFGSRFTNAIQSVLDKGYQTVISVGNDTPHLTTSHILKAKQQLQFSNYVLGPSTDGGFYLMGFKKSSFNKIRLEALPWQTSKLQYALNRSLKKSKQTTVYLEVLSDIDVASDIDLVLDRYQKLSATVRQLLIKIRKFESYISTFIPIFINHIYFKLYQNKGSPILLHI